MPNVVRRYIKRGVPHIQVPVTDTGHITFTIDQARRIKRELDSVDLESPHTQPDNEAGEHNERNHN